MKYPLFKKYFITTTLESYNQYLDYLKTINTYNIKIVDQEVTFYSNVLIEIDGFKCSNSFKDVYLKVLIKYLLLLISIITILIILFVTPYYIREVKYQTSSIKDDIVFQKTQEMVKQHKKLNLNELSKELMLKYPHYSWIGLRKQGSVLYLNIELNQILGFNQLFNTLPGDFVSGYDAYVKHIIVTKGKVTTDINQVVKKGDILITGNLSKQIIAPCGIIIGEIVYVQEIEINKTQAVYSYTGNMLNYRFIEFNKTSIKKKKNTYQNFKISTNNIFDLFGIFKIKEESIYEMNNYTISYNQEDAIVYAKSIVYFNLEKDRISEKEGILSIDLLETKEIDDKYIIKLLVRADKNIVVLRQY